MSGERKNDVVSGDEQAATASDFHDRDNSGANSAATDRERLSQDMANVNEATALIFEAIEEHFEQAGSDQPDPIRVDAVLYGEDAVLDSLGLVNVIVAVEEKLLEAFGRDIWLSDERALMQPESPYRTVETLGRYIVMLLEEPEG
jgi:acyl carrier protein